MLSFIVWIQLVVTSLMSVDDAVAEEFRSQWERS